MDGEVEVSMKKTDPRRRGKMAAGSREYRRRTKEKKRERW